ncbi:hypothetical protein Tco_1018148, partial [Tanacetum coccineum]
MRNKPGMDSLSFDNLYNNLRVFENDVKGSTPSSSNLQNVAFVSKNTSNTNDVSTAHGVSNTSSHYSRHEQTSSYSLLASQSSCRQLDHEDLDQVDEYDLEENGLENGSAMNSIRTQEVLQEDWYAKGQTNWAFVYPRDSSLTWNPTQIVIMLEQILTGNPQQEVVNFLAGDSLLGNAKSRPLWPLQQQKLNMLLLQAAVGKITPLFDNMLVQPTQDEGATSERLSEAQPSPSPEPTSEAPNESLPDSSSAQSSEVPFEQQPDLSPSPSPRPSPNPSPTPIIPDSIPEHTGENLGDHSFNDTSLSGNEDAMTLQNVYDLCISLCKQVSDQAKEIKLLKAKITKLKKKANPVIKHFKAYQKRISKEQRQQRKSLSKKKKVQIESVSKQGRKNAKGDGKAKENAQSEGRTRKMMDEVKETDEVGLSTEDEVSTDRPKLSTDDLKVSTDEQMESTNDQGDASEEIFEGTEEQGEGTEEKVKSTAEQKESTEEQTKEEIATQASQTSTQTPSSMIFGDDETIATLLINMSKAKTASKEKEKGIELKDVEDTDRPRPTSTRSTLTLKPLPKIDPKDKGKKKIEEEDETESEDDDIPQAVKKFKQLESDEELARKVQEEWEAEEERNKIAEEQATNEALIQDFDDIKARIEADRILAEKLQEQEREQFTIEERAKFLHDTIAAQRKKFEDIQAYENFISTGSTKDERLIKKLNKKRGGLSKSEVIKEETKEEVKDEDKDEESTRKRKLGTRKKMKSRKRRYIQHTSEDDSDKENDDLRLYLTIAQDEDKEVDYEILDRKYPIIDWKTECFGTKPQPDEAKSIEEINLNVVTRSNGQQRHFSVLTSVLSIFDREDLNAV